MPKFNFGSLLDNKSQEKKKIEIKKIAPEPVKKIDSLIESQVKPKKMKIGSEIDIDLKLLTKPLK